MDDFEEKLKKALQRKSPSGDFSTRVAARLAKENLEKERRTPQWRSYFRWAMAASLILVTTETFTYYQRQREREQGEAVRQQVLAALRITNEKLQIVQRRVQHLSDRRGEIQ